MGFDLFEQLLVDDRTIDVEEESMPICKENDETNCVHECYNEDGNPMARGGTVESSGAVRGAT